MYFYPRSPCGERLFRRCRRLPPFGFLSTLSLRRATKKSDSECRGSYGHFYPRSPCGERRRFCDVPRLCRGISIHALLAESDFFSQNLLTYTHYFYPRSPCGERHTKARPPSVFLQFLSTLSLRRATRSFHQCNGHRADFYPRSPCGERLHVHNTTIYRELFLSTLSLRRATAFESWIVNMLAISIHALLAESDPLKCLLGIDPEFLSTLSLRRATLPAYAIAFPMSISIHALLAESDFPSRRITPACWYFYPRSPCGERPQEIPLLTAEAIFLSTLSLRRATQKGLRQDKLTVFLSTLSLRRATAVVKLQPARNGISIHALLAESDLGDRVTCINKR